MGRPSAAGCEARRGTVRRSVQLPIMEDASTTSENAAEQEAAESAAAMPAKAVDDQLIDELVHRAQAEGLQPTGQGGLLQQPTRRPLESALLRGPPIGGPSVTPTTPSYTTRLTVPRCAAHVARVRHRR